MDDHAVRDQTSHLQVQSLVEHLWHPAESEEVVLLVEVSQHQREETDDVDRRHPPSKSQRHEDQGQDLCVVAFQFEFWQFHHLFHFGLDLLSGRSAPAESFHEAVEDGHGEGGVDNQYDGIEDDLVPDGDIPIRHEILVFCQARCIFFEIIVGDEVCNGRFERDP